MNSPSSSISYCVNNGIFFGYKDPVSKKRFYNKDECKLLKGVYNNNTKNCTVTPPSSAPISLSTTCKNVPFNEIKCFYANANYRTVNILATDSSNNYIAYWTKNDCDFMNGMWTSKVNSTIYIDDVETPREIGTCVLPATVGPPSASSNLSTECAYNPGQAILKKPNNVILPTKNNEFGKGVCPFEYIVVNPATNILECTDGGIGRGHGPLGNYGTEFTTIACAEQEAEIVDNIAYCKGNSTFKSYFDQINGRTPIHDNNIRPFGIGNNSVLKFVFPFDPINTPPSQ